MQICTSQGCARIFVISLSLILWSFWFQAKGQRTNCRHKHLRVEFLLKTDSGYPKDTGVNKPWQPIGIPSAIAPLGQLHQSPPSPIPGDLGRGPSHQSHVLKHRDTYGQAQVCSKGHQGSSVDRPCQPSFHWIRFCHVRNPLPQSIRLRLSVFVRYWAGQEV